MQQKVAANSTVTVPEGVTSVAQLAPADMVTFLAGLPQVSRPFIANWFRQNPQTTQKADQSPVTIADQQTETALRDVIAATFPDDAIQGEEFGITGNGDSPAFAGSLTRLTAPKHLSVASQFLARWSASPIAAYHLPG